MMTSKKEHHVNININNSNSNNNSNNSSNKKNNPQRTSQQQTASIWNQPLYILLAIILLQACFMLFVSMNGPSHSTSHVDMKRTNSALGDATTKKLTGGRGALTTTVWNKNKVVARKSKAPQVTVPPHYKDSIQQREWNVNARDFPGALHFHFERERIEPSFRQRQIVTTQSLMDRAQQDAKTATSLMIRPRKPELDPCHYYTDDNDGTNPAGNPPRILLTQQCFSKTHRNGLLVYNSQPFPRIWCGKTIPPNKVIHMRRVCEHAYTEPPRLLLEKDKLLDINRRDLMKLPPIVFHRVDSYAPIEAVKDCNVPCQVSMDTCLDGKGQYVKGEMCLPDISDWTVEGTDFKFRYSMLDPRNAPTAISISRKGYRENQYYATRSFQSEIPLSTFDWDRYGEMKDAPRSDFAKSGRNGICFIHLEPCQGEIHPGAWAGKLLESFKGIVDYYGPCQFGGIMQPTKTLLDLTNYQDRQSIMSKYMFTLVIGHSQEPDIISELVWDALAAGSIPVYHGAPNIREHVPPNSTIVASEYSSQQAMAEYLDRVRSDKTQWEALHAWRDDEATPLEEKYGFLKDKSSSSYCRMCRWALATKYSLGWNPRRQAIEKPALDRKFCISPKSELRYPVEEFWVSNWQMQQPLGRRQCEDFFSEQTMQFDDVSVTRKAFSHDNGVIDIAITDIKSLRTTLKVVLRLNFRAIANVEGAHIQNPHQLLSYENNPSEHIPLLSSIAIQDDVTRATILTNWVTDLKTPKFEGIVDVLVKDLTKSNGLVSNEGLDKDDNGQVPRLMKDEVLRIRIILEDINRLRDVATEYNVSPYAHQFIADFLDPLMFFMIK